jgi:hypothetical protein
VSKVKQGSRKVLQKGKVKFLTIQMHTDCKKWHAIFAVAKAAPLFATGDLRR